MLRVICISFLLALIPVRAQTPPPAAAAPPQRPPNPTRDPHTPGYVNAKELTDGENAPAHVDGDFILGPTHNPAPEMTEKENVPHGMVYNFTMESTDSKIYTGIAREPAAPGAQPAPGGRREVHSHPAPYTRKVAVYVPKQYVAGTAA